MAGDIDQRLVYFDDTLGWQPREPSLMSTLFGGPTLPPDSGYRWPWTADPSAPKTAAKCPVCDGTGHVSNGFYRRVGTDTWPTTSVEPETCRSCDGKGVVWSP